MKLEIDQLAADMKCRNSPQCNKMRPTLPIPDVIRVKSAEPHVACFTTHSYR